MNHIYAPWRSEYFKDKKSECVFCDIYANPQKDPQNGVLYKDEYCFVVMNRYPYTPGHFMVVPRAHVQSLEELDEVIWLHVSKLVKIGVKLLKETLGATGVNIGMNLGKTAGAGIAEHIHYHLVPRWERDTNFITTIGESRVYGVDFESIYQQLLAKKAFDV